MMEETCIYDKEQYFRFASADLESAYIKFLCGDNTDESADVSFFFFIYWYFLFQDNT